MSVINQMLKDLDKRQVDKSDAVNEGVIPNINNKKSNKISLIIIVLTIVLINVVGLYIWNLYTENQLLKTDAVQQKQSLASTKNLESANSLTEAIDNLAKDDNKVKNDSTASSENEIAKVNNASTSILNEEVNPTSDAIEYVQASMNLKPTKGYDANKSKPEKIEAKTPAPQIRNTIITPIQQSKPTAYIDNSQAKEVKKSSLSISRRQLSPERLSQQKIDRAELAINNHEIEKAEKLFEEVLLISPAHKSARKQLAALWFGRQLYQPAINILSRGIELHPQDIDFRLMKARILLSQKNTAQAFNVLNGLAQAKNVEYQVLLANTSQLLKLNENTILAYEELVALENHKGKWWLGLAIALDRNSEFDKAKTAYNNALIKYDLSDGSAEFIRQRLTELGE